MLRRVIALTFGLLCLLAPVSPALAQSAPGCQFVLGFKTIHDALPTVVGDCHDNEHPAGAGEEQHTAGGLMAWRKADNWTAFTDGYRTWVNGPKGLQERLNTQRFPWEKDSAPSRLQCVAGDTNCALAQAVLPRPEDVPIGYSIAAEWTDQVSTGPSYNATLNEGSKTVTVRVEPRATEYGPNSANAAYIAGINPGGWQGTHAPQVGYSADEYLQGTEIRYGWRNKNVFILLNITGSTSTDVSWLTAMAQAMQGRLAGLIGAEAPENYGPPPASSPPVPVPAVPASPQPVITPPPSVPLLPPSPARRIVIFLSGRATASDNPLTQSMFDLLKGIMTNSYGFGSTDFSMFSYRGADLLPGNHMQWRPFSACDSEQDINTSGQILGASLRLIHQQFPSDRLVLVGHSLGGLLAYEETAWAPGVPIDTVVTIDSPLHGIGVGLGLLGDLLPCDFDASELGQIMQRNVTPILQQNYDALHKEGAKVATVGNDQDCVYDLQVCGLPGVDVRFSQYAPSDWSPHFEASFPNDSSITDAHGSILRYADGMRQIAAFIGPQ